MVVKIKEISIARGRKYSQNYQSVDYHIGITIEGTTAKDTVEDMIKRAMSELTTLEIGEQSRCRDVIDFIGLEENREFKEAVDKVAKTLPEPQFTKETIEVEEMVYFDNLKNTTILGESESGLAYKVLKDGYFAYVAKSHIEPDIMPLPFGVLLTEIHIINERKWILKKDKDGIPKLEWKALGGG